MYRIDETKRARRDRKLVASMGTAIKKRFVQILNLLAENPYSDTFGGETLKYNGELFRSFELTKKDRIVVEIIEDDYSVIIYQYLGHYTDK